MSIEENDGTVDEESAVSDDEDLNPETGVVICFGSAIISAMAVIIARKKNNK